MPAYTPRFEEIFESVVLDNILAIVARDFKGALDYYYATEDLPDFAQKTLGNFIRLALPALAIEPSRGGGDESADGSHEGEQLKVTLYLAVEDADPTETVRKLVKYSRTLRAVLKTATTADFIANVPANKVFALSRELSWQYGQISKNADSGTWMKPATFELVLKYSER